MAATSQEGENNLPQRYFEKYLDQGMASIDEKFIDIKDLVAKIQRSLTQNISEM